MTTEEGRMQLPRGRDDLFFEMVVLGEHGSDEQIEAWRSGMTDGERASLNGLVTDLQASLSQIAASMRSLFDPS